MININFCKHILLVILLFLFFSGAYAQSRLDTTYIKTNKKTRLTLDLQVETASNSDYKLKYDDQTYEKGKMTDFAKTKIRLGVPILRSKQFTFSANANYSFYHLNFNQKEVLKEDLGLNFNGEHHVWGFSPNATFHTKIFSKPIITNANISFDFSEQGYERMKGIFAAVMQVKQTKSTSIGVGIIGLVNTTSPLPFIPVFTYHHQFNPQWTIDLMLPQAYLRYSFREKKRLSVGMSVDNDYFFVRQQNPLLPEKCIYSRSRLTPEIIYEQPIAKHFYMTIRGGGNIFLSNRLHSKKNYKDYIEFSQPMNSFLNIGFSYNLSR
ncbi:hypothetical protein [Parabacteroides sp. Marseille-P3160]|uniref:hypothetical protein n=1 Tax=Parabacteroides sp. Marseille-P3160 TaxID=1917887 RepID=UPI0009BC3F47|nr:hypothetical protein [Parabacteroides sp. Marseille-P3160]